MSETRPSPITPAVRRRFLRALDAGLPPPAACRRAGIDFATWEAERARNPVLAAQADRIETSGLEAAMRFLQMTAATEWRCALEVVKLHYSLRGREVVRVDEHDPDELETDIAPEAVAAVIRFLHGHHEVLGAEADGHHSSRRGANGARESDK